MEDRFARQARNEALFREVNERIAQLGERAQTWSPDGTDDYVVVDKIRAAEPYVADVPRGAPSS
jgi:hypothetical protein